MTMRVLVSTDIEGVAGVFHNEQVRPGNPEYERARGWMTAEANAAARGAFDGGATDVIVNDSHGGFRNILAHQLDARVRVVQGKPRMLGMVGGLEEGCDAVILVGYHSRAQGRGILAHTINGFAFARVFINGQELGEAGLYGALAGELGVPVILATGDDVFIQENRPLFPGAQWVQTKTAYGQGSGVSLTPQQSCEAIAEAARVALRDLASAVPLRIEPPIECQLQVQTTALADLFCLWPSLERVDGVTIRFAADSMKSAVRMLNSLSAMSFMLR
jgi:D-amino peptidase